MDTGAFFFTFLLIVVGIIFIFKYLPSKVEVEEVQQDEELPRESEARRQALREANRMRRRRSQVWWKVENLYSELRQKTAVDDLANEPTSTPPAAKSQTESNACERLTSSEVSQAFESFLRRTK